MHCFSYHPGLVSTDVDVHRAMVQVLPSPVQVIASSKSLELSEFIFRNGLTTWLARGIFVWIPELSCPGLNLWTHSIPFLGPLRLNKFERGVIIACHCSRLCL